MELLSRLRRAVKKLTFLLNLRKYLNQSSWRFASLIARAPAAMITGPRWRRRRALSFNDRPGLRACVDLDAPEHRHGSLSYDDNDENNVGSEGSSGATSPSRVLRRATSCPLSPLENDDEEDVDKRAEMFIAWFREQLNYERQISLDLRYCRGYSFDNSTLSNDESNVSSLSSAASQLVLSPT